MYPNSETKAGFVGCLRVYRAAFLASVSQPYRYAIANTRKGCASMNRSAMSSARKCFCKPSISNLKVASMTFCSPCKDEKWGILETLTGKQRLNRRWSVSLSSVIWMIGSPLGSRHSSEYTEGVDDWGRVNISEKNGDASESSSLNTRKSTGSLSDDRNITSALAWSKGWGAGIGLIMITVQLASLSRTSG